MRRILIRLKILMDYLIFLFKRILSRREYKLFERKPFDESVGTLYKIEDWQWRESNKSSSYKKQLTGKIDMNKASEIHKWVLNNIIYTKDEILYSQKDYWATSNEVLEKGSGDCEDIGIAHWRLFRDAGFPDDSIFIGLLVNHAFAGIQIPEENDFWVLDNGYLSYSIVKASQLFPQKGKLLCGFNLFDVWSY